MAKRDIYGTWEGSKWFEFEDGSNPYMVWGNRQDEFFRMIVYWRPKMVNNKTFRCPKEPTKMWVYPSYDFSVRSCRVSYFSCKQSLLDFAKEWKEHADFEKMSESDLEWYMNFFRQYGKRYGCLRVLRKMIGI